MTTRDTHPFDNSDVVKVKNLLFTDHLLRHFAERLD